MDGKPVNLETLMLNLFKGHTMKNDLLDYLTAIGLGLCLCIGLMAWFDVLVK